MVRNAFGTAVAEPEEEVAIRRQPPYHVLIENDDYHTVDFVVAVLREVFKYELPKAFELMKHAHENGEAVVWTGSFEVAELKLEQILSFREKGPGFDFGPLGARIEPAA